jgi:hypothetical protein
MTDSAHLPEVRTLKQNRRLGKRLEQEIYVASEASATPLRNYAPLSRFSARKASRCLGLGGSEMLSSPDFSIAHQALAVEAICISHPGAKHLISSGFSL